MPHDVAKKKNHQQQTDKGDVVYKEYSWIQWILSHKKEWNDATCSDIDGWT